MPLLLNGEKNKMELKILYVKDGGDESKERIVLQATDDCDIGTYVLFNTAYDGKYISNKIRYSFWFPNKDVKSGDKIIVYTKKGEEKFKENRDRNSSYFFYWGLDTTIWSKGEDCAGLIKIEEYIAKTINV